MILQSDPYLFNDQWLQTTKQAYAQIALDNRSCISEDNR